MVKGSSFLVQLSWCSSFFFFSFFSLQDGVYDAALKLIPKLLQTQDSSENGLIDI
ncbi:hypothetical protein E1A91_D02G174300v1 [Gossypium mustelinum]|nr:hypothetical protein E1A91_D02G174300v1 [Gossypium mustelinum]TYI94008.1 hypothetical protein E1A91_D02G174300v1 [Gossypium mustelinum]